MLLIVLSFVSAVVIERATPTERRTEIRMALAMALSSWSRRTPTHTTACF
jgi:hypothetical protein